MMRIVKTIRHKLSSNARGHGHASTQVEAREREDKCMLDREMTHERARECTLGR